MDKLLSELKRLDGELREEQTYTQFRATQEKITELLPSLISRLEQADEMERLCQWLLRRGSFFSSAIEEGDDTLGPHGEAAWMYDYECLEKDLQKLFPPAPTKGN